MCRSARGRRHVIAIMLVAMDTTPAPVLMTVSQKTIKSFVFSSTPEIFTLVDSPVASSDRLPGEVGNIVLRGTLRRTPNLATSFAQVCLPLPHPNRTPVVGFGHGCPFLVVTPQVVGNLAAISQQTNAMANDALQNASSRSCRDVAYANAATVARKNVSCARAISFFVVRFPTCSPN